VSEDVRTEERRSDVTSTLDRFFKLREHGTDVRTELVAGLTTFLAMAYIVFVNPDILSATGMDAGAVFVATCLAAAIGTLIMGLWARYPIAQAPGMGLNAFFAFTVVITYGYTWQEALAWPDPQTVSHESGCSPTSYPARGCAISP
jgi:xanthine/uracil/vitamin C permease (AzgA family)